MRPSPDPDNHVELGRWGIFAVVVVAGIVLFFVFARDIAPLAGTGTP